MTGDRADPSKHASESATYRPDTVDDVLAFVSSADADVVLVRWDDDGTPRTVFGTEFARLAAQMTPTARPAVDVVGVDRTTSRSVPVAAVEWLRPLVGRTEATRALPDDVASRVRTLRGLAAAAPALVEINELLRVLDTANERRTGTLIDALETIATLVDARPTDCVVAVPYVQRLVSEAVASETRAAAVHCLAMFAMASPADVTPHVATVFPLLEEEVGVPRNERSGTSTAVDAAVACVAHVASDDPAAVIDCADALCDVLAGESSKRRMHAAYAIGRISLVAPESVRPAVAQLAAVAGDETEEAATRLNATCAVGRVAGPWPDEVVTELEAFVAILRSAESDAALRANAAGVVGDIANAHAIDVRRHVGSLVANLDDDDSTTRANVSTALARVAQEFPNVMTPHLEAFVTRLDDEESLVRENACWALGYLREEAAPAQSKLERVRLTDGDEEVRARAAWALDAVDGGGSDGVGV